MRETVLAVCALAVLGCAGQGPAELRLEGEETLRDCAAQRVDASVCLSLEVIQAEYDQCVRLHPGDARCEEVWQAVAGLAPPAALFTDIPDLRRNFGPER
jgi:hypothetical protein